MTAEDALPATFWAKVDKSDDCWVWTANLSPDGYGRFCGYARYGTSLPHKASWQVVNGPVPDGLELDHTCNNRACVRPDHMEPVTHLENCRRAASRRTQCRKGHKYTADNRVAQYDKPGERCLICRREASSKSLREKRRREHPTDRPFPYDVKVWAIAQGLPVKMQGSPSKAVVAAYIAAHPEWAEAISTRRAVADGVAA